MLPVLDYEAAVLQRQLFFLLPLLLQLRSPLGAEASYRLLGRPSPPLPDAGAAGDVAVENPHTPGVRYNLCGKACMTWLQQPRRKAWPLINILYDIHSVFARQGLEDVPE